MLGVAALRRAIRGSDRTDLRPLPGFAWADGLRCVCISRSPIVLGNLRRQLLVFGELFVVVQSQRPTQTRRQGVKQLCDRFTHGYRTSPRCFHLYQFSASLRFNFDIAL